MAKFTPAFPGYKRMKIYLPDGSTVDQPVAIFFFWGASFLLFSRKWRLSACYIAPRKASTPIAPERMRQQVNIERIWPMRELPSFATQHVYIFVKMYMCIFVCLSVGLRLFISAFYFHLHNCIYTPSTNAYTGLPPRSKSSAGQLDPSSLRLSAPTPTLPVPAARLRLPATTSGPVVLRHRWPQQNRL
jgi:hypothetical protein